MVLIRLRLCGGVTMSWIEISLLVLNAVVSVLTHIQVKKNG